ncbi:hypothetical protein NB573_09800 [Vibrio alginolyticus]|uniref:hypothetical protein n=1 Tax=Vibrio alginolyticus TaxID=663 RepID=UPI00215BCFE5|nr:hypothetical protein [Vibrio alginolyticus]MCR9960335.1 hypothetical protein [Vibrio alginolyticus]
MTQSISFQMGNVSGTAVAPINADATVASGAASNALTFITPIIAQKGQPNEVIAVTSGNVESVLGKAYHSSFGPNADGRRVLDEALKGGSGYVVRVVPATATYPAIKFTKGVDDEVSLVKEAINYSTELSLSDNEFFALAIKDGANSENRTVSITPADEAIYGPGMHSIVLKELNEAGAEIVLEEWVISFRPEVNDSMGSPAYVETVLENKSNYLKCVVDASITSVPTFAFNTDVLNSPFTGASNGSIKDIKVADFAKAIELIDTTTVSFNHIDAFGIYDTEVQKDLIAIANAKRVGCFFDLDPRLTFAEALIAKQGLNLNEHRASYYHFPYTAKCPTYQNKALWGLSGIAFAAKAKGLSRNSPTPGWHYTAAGVDRATISRTNLAPMKGAGKPDYEAMYKARLNKVAKDESGVLFIDDSLTSAAQENYLRFEQAVSVTDAISREFNSLANRIKHNPDGITFDGLNDGMGDILDAYDSIGALVTPRNPEVDGTESYKFEVTQVSIDHWKVIWSICPTGSGRRFSGEPILVQ